ncbi:MAG: aspartate aminotransferase family protein [Gammaproteobacteria bacterium]
MNESHIFPRIIGGRLPTVAYGDGVYLVDTDGRRYLDGCGGAAVSCLGHSNAAISAAVKKQIDAVAWAHTSFFTSAPAEELAAILADAAPPNLNRVWFVCGGSEAVESALKLARQYFLERGEPARKNIIARRQSYHGATLGALSAGHNPMRREMFAPLLSANAHHIDPCHYWRGGRENESAEEYGRRAADCLEEKILQLGAETVAAFVAETVSGATLGAVCAEEGYFRRIREICDRHGVLLILDEVMCGTGRTGTMFAFEREGIVPDMVCIAKGLGGGVQPLGAMLCDEKIYAAVAGGSGAFRHGHTYLCHPAACAAGVAVMNEIRRHDLLARVNEKGAKLAAALRDACGENAHVGDIRGRGLFWGMEFVAEGRTPFAPERKIHARVKNAAFARGLMVYGIGGAMDGERGDHLLIAPPFIIDDDHIAELAEKLAAAIGEATA